jgi:hypothetical protein
MTAEFQLLHGDILSVPSDLLLLKYAQAAYGLDWTVASILIGNGVVSRERKPLAPNEYEIVDAHLPIITAPQVMFIGTASIDQLGYRELHAFARRAIQVLVAEELPVKTLTTPIHGPGFGLDVSEAIQQMAVGFLEGIREFEPRYLQRITFVEKNERRLGQMAAALESIDLWHDPKERELRVGPRRATAGKPQEITLEKREHVFVAVPFAEEFQDVYEFGIYAPVRSCGYICERVDETSFTGDVLQRIRSRVESARFVIADLTDARPNVYLEVGYAWGKEVPVIFLAREGQTLHFDVRTHRCIYYRTIGQLSRDLERLIRGLTPQLPPA